MSDHLNVILGPPNELHPGVHGSLLEHPPANITYCRAEYEFWYLYGGVPKLDFTPFDHFSLSETVKYFVSPALNRVVHSSRIPVSNALPWVVDADCLIATLRYGQFFILGSLERAQRLDVPASLMRRRQTIMLRHYLVSACKAILFRSNYYRQRTVRYLQQERLLSPQDLELFERKTDVVYPTFSPNTPTEREPGVVSVIYVGRSYEDKGGDIALEIFLALKQQYRDRVRLLFVGEAPRVAQSASPGIKFLPWMTRSNYLRLLNSCDILLSPTTSESHGATLMEAASSGLAIVSMKGDGMGHIQELFEDGNNALLVSNALPKSSKVKELARLVSILIDQPMRLRNMSASNLELFKKGKLSIEQRDRVLLFHYRSLGQHLTERQRVEADMLISSLRKDYELQCTTIEGKLCQCRFRQRLLRAPKRVWVN